MPTITRGARLGICASTIGDGESFAPSLCAGKTRQLQAAEGEELATTDRAMDGGATDRDATGRGAMAPVAGSDGAAPVGVGFPWQQSIH